MGEAPVQVDIPLTDGDRFLTLAVTDGGDGTTWDWAVWGDPTFEVSARVAQNEGR